MLRATLLSALALVAIACQTAAAEPATQPAVNPGQATAEVQGDKSHTSRVLFIIEKNCTRCEAELAWLRRPGGDFGAMRARGWKIGEGPENHLQIVDRQVVAELVEKLDVHEFPTVACVEGDQIVRSFKAGCTTPLDAWTFGFLAKGVDERPPGLVSEAARVETTNHWPLRGNHWSIDEDWNPTKTKVVSHLRGPNHGHQIKTSWEIETRSSEELRSLHDDLHEREMGGVSGGLFSTRSQPADQFGAGRKATGR